MTNTILTTGTPALQGLCDGFADITHQSQQVFRSVLAAMAEPGTVHGVGSQKAPAPLSAAAYQVCLALLDQETPLWLHPELASAAALNSLRFHCGCVLTDRPEVAAFALTTVTDAPPLVRFQQGSVEYPDRSATVVVEVLSLAGGAGEGRGLVLSGPGIRDERRVQIGGFDEAFARQLSDNHRRFPCGVDLILTSDDQLMALPRTTRVVLDA